MKMVLFKDRVTKETTEIKVGDWVCFKSDIEQSGKVIQIQLRANTWNARVGEYVLVLENENGFRGEYIGGDTKTVVTLDEIWVD